MITKEGLTARDLTARERAIEEAEALLVQKAEEIAARVIDLDRREAALRMAGG